MPVTVGVVCGCTGAFGVVDTTAVDVLKAWAQYTNTNGGLAGHPVKLTVDDVDDDPGKAETAAKALIAAHVDVIVDSDVLDATWQNDVAAAHIPVVGVQSNTAPYTTNPDFFPSGQTLDSINESVISAAKAAGAKTVGQFYCAESPQCQQGVPVIKRNAAAAGLSDIYDVSIAATAPNYTAQCVAAKQANVQALIVLHISPTVARVGQDCTTQQYQPIYITEGTGFSEHEATAPGIVNNLWTEFPILPYWANQPEVKLFRDTVDKYYPGLRDKPDAWAEPAAQAWTAGLLIRDGVRASGLGPRATPSAQALLQGLNSLSHDTLDGWSPPLTFKPGKPHLVDCWFIGHVDHGKRTLVNGGRLSCSSNTQSP